MGIFKEIQRADDTGVTTFYRIDNSHDVVETDADNITKDMFDYNNALNKPNINGVTLIGDKTSEELGLQPAGDYLTEVPEEYVTEEELENMHLADKDYVKKMISEIEHFHREIVEALPRVGKDNVLYMVKKNGTNGDVYNEYIWTGTDFEFIGTTAPDLTIFYTKEEANKLLNNKVDKVAGKQLSTNDFTNDLKNKLEDLENYDDTELRNKVNQLHNYDDTQVKRDIADLQTKEKADRTDINELKEQIVEKLEAVFLIRSGDTWFWQNRDGDNITFKVAQNLLELENYILVMEYLETDGKITPIEYISLDDRMIVYYSDEENKRHILTLQDGLIEDNFLGYEVNYKASVPTKDNLPKNVFAGTLCVTEDDKNIYLYDGRNWIAANPEPLIDLSNYLSKTNRVPYVPTEDFHPATKQYVDQNIKSLDDKKKIPTRLSQLVNDMDFIPKSTTELTNYYTKNNLYTKADIDKKFRELEEEDKVTVYDWSSSTHTGDYNDVNKMQTFLEEYIRGETSGLTLKLRDKNDEFNGIYGVWEFKMTGNDGHLWLGSGDKYYTYGTDGNNGASITNSNAIMDIQITIRNGLYTVVGVALRRKEEVIANYLSTTTLNNVNYTPTLDGHPATKKYVDDRMSNASASLKVVTTSENGLCPKLGGGTTNFLRADGTWSKPPGNDYKNATTTSSGLMSSTDKATLDDLSSTVSNIFTWQPMYEFTSTGKEEETQTGRIRFLPNSAGNTLKPIGRFQGEEIIAYCPGWAIMTGDIYMEPSLVITVKNSFELKAYIVGGQDLDTIQNSWNYYEIDTTELNNNMYMQYLMDSYRIYCTNAVELQAKDQWGSFEMGGFWGIVCKSDDSMTNMWIGLQYQKVKSEGSASIDTSSFVTVTGNQTISGTKTFNSFPVSSGTPTSGTQLTNKNYVDNKVSGMITATKANNESDAQTKSKSNPGVIYYWEG